MPDKAAVARDWLKALAVLCANNVTQSELVGKLNAYAPMLAQEFSDGAFSAASLAAIGRKFTFFPSFAELTEALSSWWQEHRPNHVPRIAADQDATIRQREIERNVRVSWETVSAADVRAKIRAVRDSPLQLSLGAFLAAALRKHAPQHLALLPPAWLKEPAEPAEVAALRRSATLTMTSEVKRANANDEDWRHADA
jgi:hypothetical protein